MNPIPLIPDRLRCVAPSGYRFTPGRDYATIRNELEFRRREGGRLLTGPEHYVELWDDQRINRRFCSHPRAGVRNEHPFPDLWLIFRKPTELTQAESVEREEYSRLAGLERAQTGGQGVILTILAVIQAKGVVRPLLVIPRGAKPGVERWRAELESLARNRVIPIPSARAYNAILLAGELPEALYVTSLRHLFALPDGSPAPSVAERHDFLYVALAGFKDLPDCVT